MPSDSVHGCWITAVCVLQDGKVLVADRYNKNVKLLNQQHQVISHWSSTAYPRDMCLITPSEAAVVANCKWTHEVQFIRVRQSMLSSGIKFQLQHSCM
ncbi:hypothetical protein DPMN_130588 [Dreissena polymorpha]|uniref:Uncharacterized protein n=1 Tax=Dreissena polymorpha TaxID=45954 RepID=A0A9D4JYI5_DREPO|nr:hypothetical protein DPMN_130588 [Dreissena polymorpha]